MAFPFAATTIAAQPGPQTEFLRSRADICIYGGAAGGGKTAGLILEPLRHVGRVANFTTVFFRRTMPQITNPGALWDESLNFYPRLGGTPHLGMREWRWPRGGKIKFSHLQFETTVYDWQGAQIALICFDELTHFTAHQFFYMVSRNRSTCGVRPYIRATCNPDADSWVADFLAWWIDAETGLPVPERAGVLRYYARVSDKIVWADRPEELMQDLPRTEDLPPGLDPAAADQRHVHPGDGARQPRSAAGQPRLFQLAIVTPAARTRAAVGWQLEDPAGRWSLFQARVVCCRRQRTGGPRYRPLLGSRRDRKNRVQRPRLDGRGQARPRSERRLTGCWIWCAGGPTRATSTRLLLNTATQDGKRVRIGFGQDPGQAGKSQALHLVRALSGFTVTSAPESGNKLTRFGPFSSQCRAGNVKIRRGPWNEELFRILEGFPDLAHDDEVDACSGALEMLSPNMKGWGYYEYVRQLAQSLEQRDKPQPTQTVFAEGSVEWLAEQNKSS